MLTFDEYKFENDIQNNINDPLADGFICRRYNYSFSEKNIVNKDVYIQNDKTGESQYFSHMQMEVNSENQLFFCQLVESLKKCSIPLDNSNIYIWDEIKKQFVFLDVYPLLQPYYIDFEQFKKSPAIYIKFRDINSVEQEFSRRANVQMEEEEKVEDSTCETEEYSAIK